MAKRLPSGKPIVGAQRNQSNFLTDVVTFTGSTTVNLARALRKKGAGASKIDYVRKFVVVATQFEDAGGAATVHRLADVNNNDGTFTINASKETGAAGVYATATNPCTVRWTVLITE